MNLFDILSSGKRSLSEENVSAFLAWLLEPGQSHGFGPLVLKHLIELMPTNKFDPIKTRLSDAISYRKQSDIRVNVLLEKTVFKNVKRDIDIVIEIENDDKFYIISIENKIRIFSDESQLKEEYEGLLEEYGEDVTICMIYVTPDKSTTFIKAFNKLPDDAIKMHVTWKNNDEEQNNSIVDIIKNILICDNDAKINPLSYEVRFVLKSFIVFAENDFKLRDNDDKYTTRGTKYYKGVVAGLEGINSLLVSTPEGDKRNSIIIGFENGEKRLKETPLEKLINRPYKWDNEYTGKKRKYWININQFKKIIIDKGWQFQE